jgi:hypothetical protein
MTRLLQKASSIPPLVLFVMAVFVPAQVAPAPEATTRTVRGQVLDEKEKPVERAIVHLTSLGTKKHLSTTTDKDGRYQFNEVSRKDDFEVVAEAGGRKSRPRKLSQFDSRAIVFLHLRLEPAKEKADAGEGKGEKKDD